jgi:hypothetical protein
MTDSIGAMRSLFPTWYKARLPTVNLIQIIFWEWLAYECPAPEEIESILKEIRGWRRREVIEFLKNDEWFERNWVS